MSRQSALRLKDDLFARFALSPTDQWLNAFLSTSRNPNHPLSALTSTAHFRLLGTDLTNTLTTCNGQILPPQVSDVNTKELYLQTDVPVQVLDIRDTSTSNWSQFEGIERVERGEEIRGREVIRNVPGGNEDDDVTAGQGQEQTSSARTSVTTAFNTPGHPSMAKKGSTGPHKLVLQDAAGSSVWGFELSRIDKITIINSNPPLQSTSGPAMPAPPVEGMQIGCKLLLKKGTRVRRGLVMLTPATVTVMGGKVETWDNKWRETRKARLLAELAQQDADTAAGG